jgi:uncharacterized protein (DUF58 family)
MTLQELLQSVHRLEVKTNRLVNDMMVGAYLSHFKGRGMDFEELREYVPGDDVRTIDWNVTNRMGRPFVKRFREERELTLILAVDVSGSSMFGSGSRTRREYASEIAATLAMAASRSSDKVGLLMFSDRTELYLPPRKGRRNILRILRELLTHRTVSRQTNVGAALAFVNQVVGRRSIVFLLTDFLHGFPAGSPEKQPQTRNLLSDLGMSNARHDLVCVHLVDPRETEIPAAGLVTLEDSETGEVIEVDAGRAATRSSFKHSNTQRILDLDQTLQQAGIETLRFIVGEPFAYRLQRFFETRRSRRR